MIFTIYGCPTSGKSTTIKHIPKTLKQVYIHDADWWNEALCRYIHPNVLNSREVQAEFSDPKDRDEYVHKMWRKYIHGNYAYYDVFRKLCMTGFRDDECKHVVFTNQKVSCDLSFTREKDVIKREYLSRQIEKGRADEPLPDWIDNWSIHKGKLRTFLMKDGEYMNWNVIYPYVKTFLVEKKIPKEENKDVE